MQNTTSSSTPSTSPLRAMLRWWPLSLVLIALGVTLGGGYAQSRPTTYTADARLAVGGSDIAAQAIPGFALASQQIASNYARFVSTSATVRDLPPGEGTAVVSVIGSPIPTSNVVLIEAKATNAAVARDAADLAAKSLTKQVNDAVDTNSSAQTLQQYTQVSAKVAQAQVTLQNAQHRVSTLTSSAAAGGTVDDATLAEAQKALELATTTLSTLTVQQTALGNRYQTEFNTTPSQSRLSVVQTAAAAGDDQRTRLERYGVLGLAAGFGLALLVVVPLERRRVRRRAAVEDHVALPSWPPSAPPDSLAGLDARSARPAPSSAAARGR